MDPARFRKGAPIVRTGDAGFSLPVVLWSLLLASMLVIGFLAASRTSIRIASNTASHAQVAALAEAGVSIAVLDLVEASRRQGAGRRIAVDGTPAECRMPGGARIEIAIEDEGGKVDINRADETLVRYLLAGLGHSPSEASRLADRILDYRDPDELRRLNGAEREDYRRAGAASGPADAPLLSVEEITQVLGMPPATAERLFPLVTIDSGTPGIDLGLAPAELVGVLERGLTGVAELSTAGGTVANRAAVPLPPIYRVRSPGTAFLVRATARLPDGSSAHSAAIVELVRKRSEAYRFRRRLSARSFPSASDGRRKTARDIGDC